MKQMIKYKKLEDLPKNPDWNDKEQVKAIQDFLYKEFQSRGLLNKPIGINWQDIGIKRRHRKVK